MNVHELDVTPWLLREDYEQAWQANERRVHRWEWTRGPRYSFQGEIFRRQNKSRGRRLEVEPAEKAGHVVYGFDEQGLLLLERSYGEDNASLATLYTYPGGYLQGVTYLLADDDCRLFRVMRAAYADDNIIDFNLYTAAPAKSQRHDPGVDEMACTYRELYTYDDDGRLVNIRTMQMLSVIQVKVVAYALVYDSIGRLDYIQQIEDGDSFIVYQRPLHGQTLVALTEAVQGRLLSLVPSLLVDSLEPGEQAYCLALIYDLADENCLPPTLALGMVTARDQLLAAYGDDAADYLWDPEIFTGYAELDDGQEIDGKPPITLEDVDDVLDEASFMLNQQIAFLDDWVRVRHLLNEVARRLMAIDWSQVDGLTPDFVVFATDSDFEDFEDNFTFSVPAERVEALRQDGLF